MRNSKGQFVKGHSVTFVGNPIYKECLVCGKEFRTYKCKLLVGKGKYCSKECSLKETNKKLSLAGVLNRFSLGQETWNKIGFTFSKNRNNKYKLIYQPEHPNSDKKGYVREHRLVIENNIGRYLLDNEVVHHIDGNTLNNDLSNLQILSRGDHTRLHLFLRRI